MHIKQVIIRGFKTYKDSVQLERDFDRGVNVVVGYNGSGKSNFFNAILFVISDRFGTLRNETRKSLLHEGSGPAVLTAFVELVFDNSDKRMPLDRDEVRIRRTIAAKKDDYTLDGKVATRAEVFKLLESCGFAKSNPYYIVQQGKVSELTVMTDANRLELFKEVSGASTYDERRAECARILEELRVKREKTTGVVDVVRRRILALEDEQKELRQYQKLEQQRRCLEYVITSRDWQITQERLVKLEVDKTDKSNKVHQAQRDLGVAQEHTAAAEADVFQGNAAKASIMAKREEQERLRGLRVEELTRARLEHEDEKQRAEATKQVLKETNTEKEKIEAQMNEVQNGLAAKQPDLDAKQVQLREMSQRKHVAQVERDALLAKQGRGSHYTSVAQRNKFLDDELKRRQPQREQQHKSLQDCGKKIKELLAGQRKCSKTISDRKESNNVLEKTLAESATTDHVHDDLEQACEKRRSLLQDREHVSRDCEHLRTKVGQLQSRVEATMPRPVRRALMESLAKVNESGMGSRVLGPLIDSITVDEKYAVAVESAAGNALFNLLVVDDDIAADIIKHVRQHQLGSIVCTPLNQIRPRPRDYPKIKGAVPLVDLIQCPDEVRPAVLQVFGRTMVCNNLEICDTISTKHSLDAVTIEGDRVSSQGTMTGGYQDPGKYVRLQLVAERRKFAARLEEYDKKTLPDIDLKVKEASKSVEQLQNQKRASHALRQTRRTELAQAAEAIHEAERELQRVTEGLARQKEREHEAATSLAEYDAGIEALTRERQSKTLGQLSAEEHADVEKLTNELRQLTKDCEVSQDECHKLTRELRSQEQHLNGYLRRRHHEIEADIMRANQQDHMELALERKRAVDRLTAQLDDAEKEMLRLSGLHEEEEKQSKALKKQLDRVMKEATALQSNVEAQLADIDDTAMKIINLSKIKAEHDEKLRKLTVVTEHMNRYKELPTDDIINTMRDVSKELQKFEHVNKKAIDQFTTFQDQLKDLDEEALEITRSTEAIEHFIQEVDAKKEHLLTDVLLKVNKHFREIFAELVREGKGKLSHVMSVDDDFESHEAKKRKVPHVAPELASGIKGVKIEVSFSGQETSFLTMSQLSGGQKTVVALALIFAMQRLEPAPFYLFDEVDAALDTQYRTAVARLIQKDAANGAQMIITTFRPEIIEVADSCYRVNMMNRVSAINSVDRAQAKEVVDQQVTQEGLGD